MSDDTIPEELSELEEEPGEEREEPQLRRRSVSSVTPSARSPRMISRGRSHSSAGPKGASPRREEDASALSVEVAVAQVQQRQQQWREQQQREHEQHQQHQQQRQQQPTDAGKNSHRRTRSMMSRVLTPMLGNANMGNSARGSRLSSLDERSRRNSLSTARTDRVSSTDRTMEEEKQHADVELLEDSKEEEEDEEEEEEEHQQVVRRHEPQRSVPSILDLFNLKPGTFAQPPPSHVGNASPLRGDVAATYGDLAGSLSPGRQRQQQPHQALENDVERERGAGRDGSDAAGGRCFHPGRQQQQQQQATPPPALPENYSFHSRPNSPPTAYRDKGGTTAPSPLPAHQGRQGASVDGGGSAAASPRPRGQDGEDRRHQQQRGDSRGSGAAGPKTIAAVDAAGSLGDGLGLDGSGGGAAEAIAALQQQELSLARHMREASTNTVDAGRGGRSPFRGAASASAAAGRSDGLVVDKEGVRIEDLWEHPCLLCCLSGCPRRLGSMHDKKKTFVLLHLRCTSIFHVLSFFFLLILRTCGVVVVPGLCRRPHLLYSRCHCEVPNIR